MKISEAKPGERFIDRSGSVWERIEDGALCFWNHVLKWPNAQLQCADDQFGPFLQTSNRPSASPVAEQIVAMIQENETMRAKLGTAEAELQDLYDDINATRAELARTSTHRRPTDCPLAIRLSYAIAAAASFGTTPDVVKARRAERYSSKAPPPVESRAPFPRHETRTIGRDVQPWPDSEET